MSGHSKWATIKHKKGAATRSAASSSRSSRARSSWRRRRAAATPTNIALQNAIEKARAVSMPKDNIERAIARGAGAARAASIRDRVYEGYGPGGAALIVEGLTDNRNRTAADVRSAFTKFGGSLGTPARSPGCSTARA